MKNLKTILLSILLLTSTINAEDTLKKDREISVRKTVDTFSQTEQKDISIVDKFKHMFTEGKVTGQVRSMYAAYNQKALGETDTYATAIGGMLKYELASLNGFNAGVAFTSSHDVGFATGGNIKQNSELSSLNGSYSVVNEAYINYGNNGFNLRAGRQILETPLADSDDIRMVPNTFEAYIARYEVADFIFTAGNIQRWQGADAGLGYDGNGDRQSSDWTDLGDGGTWLVGMTHEGVIDINAWYYDIPQLDNAIKATYLDLGIHKELADVSLYGAVQYLNELEAKNSGVEADIYGVFFELIVNGIDLNVGYNKSTKHAGKRSFSGFGGGTLYTNMDTMIIDNIADDREAEAMVIGLSYITGDWEFIYAYGDFDGKANSAGDKEHIVEQNIGFQYAVSDEIGLAAIYVREEDKQSTVKTTNDWDRFQVMAKYDF